MAKYCQFLGTTKNIHHLSTDLEMKSASAFCKVGSYVAMLDYLKKYCLSTSEQWARCENYAAKVRNMK